MTVRDDDGTPVSAVQAAASRHRSSEGIHHICNYLNCTCNKLPLCTCNELIIQNRRRWRDRGRAGDLLSAAGDLGLAVGQAALLAAQEQAAPEAEHARVGVQDEGGDAGILQSAALALAHLILMSHTVVSLVL